MHPVFRFVRHLADGIAMGVANLIPGVSGGTIALILGIYERLIAATSDAVRSGVSLVRLDFRRGMRGLGALPWAFLVPILVGMIGTPLLAAGWLEGQLEQRPEVMRGIFLGLVAGSLPVPWVRMRRRGADLRLFAVAAAVAAWFLVGLPPRTVLSPTDLQVFVSAILAISAMVLPGVSGSFLLLVLGMYAPTLAALDALDLRYIAVFAAGAGVGLAAFAVFMNWLLARHHDATMAVLVGLMAGSLRALWPWQSAGAPRLADGAEPVLPVVAWAVVALALSAALAWAEIRRQRRSREVSADSVTAGE
jgi:putative membrane protein